MRNEKLAMRNIKAGGKGRKFVFTFFFFLFSVFICIACENIFEPPKTENVAAKDAGTGYFSLALGGTGRTIIPSTALTDFEAYTLEFSVSGTTGSPVVREERTKSNLSVPVSLSAGTWDLLVTAYMDEEETKAAAQGELKGIVIGTWETVVRSITLGPIKDGSGMGTFRWEIDYLSNFIEASMTITCLPVTPETVPVHNVTFTEESKTGSVPLQTGYYRVAFKLKNGEGMNERWETLHIYQNMESTFTDTLTLLSSDDIKDFGARAVISNIFNVSTTEDWNDTITAIANGGNDKNYIISVMGDEAITVTGTTTATFGYDVTGIKVSLRGEGKALTLSGTGSIFRIKSNQTVILRDLTLQGHSSNNTSLVHVEGTSSAFTMQSGKISGNTGSYGAGVQVSAGGTFTMVGGSISNNTANNDGGGVQAGEGGIFIMNNGSISGNKAASGGGVHVWKGAFTMKNGIISDNTITRNGGGVFVGGDFDMNGGEIFGNTSSGTATTNGGGGVYLGGVDGATISGYLRISEGIIYGNTEADTGLRNTASRGAALYLYSGNAQRGTFDGSKWSNMASLGSTTNNTIKVENGNIVQ